MPETREKKLMKAYDTLDTKQKAKLDKACTAIGEATGLTWASIHVAIMELMMQRRARA